MAFKNFIEKHFYVDSATHERTRVAWVVGITLVCMAASLLITYILISITNSPKLPIIFILAALAPGIIAPVTSWIIIGVVIKVARLEELHRRLATYDDLSGLLNRRAFLERCELLISVSERKRLPFSLAILDLDNFKQINDKYGHGGGDAVISTFSGMVRQAIRDVDLAGRTGGEEFAIGLYSTDQSAAWHAMERLRQKVEESSVSYQGQQIAMTVSIGIASTNAHETADLDELARHADAAMYLAKNLGKNRLHQATGTVHQENLQVVVPPLK